MNRSAATILKRRVVVTGMGIICPLGHSLQSVWNAIKNNRSGLVSLQKTTPLYYDSFYKSKGLSFDGIPSQVAGIVSNDLKIENYKDTKKLSPFMLYAMAAADEAVADSGYRPKSKEERERMGICIGSGIGCLEETIDNYQAFKDGVSPSIISFYHLSNPTHRLIPGV